MKLKSVSTMSVGLLAIVLISSAVVSISPKVVLAACIPGVYNIYNGAACAQPTGTNGVLFGQGGIFTSIVNTALFAIGAVAVLMLIYGGIRYTISGGDEKAITGAKNTILYAVVGIVIAILAYAIINFVLSSLMSTGTV